MPAFRHHDLSLLNPAFDSPLVDVVTELEHLRRLRLEGSTPAPVFFQLKQIFHMLESLGSARIEGNHTTLADYVESRLEASAATVSDTLREMANIEEAMTFIEVHFAPGDDITEHLVRELHALTVRELQREGDATPGAYRHGSVQISQSDHLPPEALQVPQYMSELVAFINQPAPRKYDLIKVALAHHRFAWIHPFGNGNGRVVRLLTYTLMIKYGFDVKAGGRVLNPTAVFCNDRDRYYAMLSQADTGTQEGREAWCTYVLSGVLDELGKVARLTDQRYLIEHILTPALRHARERESLTHMEERVLMATAHAGIAKASDLKDAMPGMTEAQRTYQIRKLVERRMLVPIRDGARQYTVGFSNNVLLRGVIRALAAEGFIPDALNRPG
ncbi:Fic family protein [Methyloversatilis sp.]|uniref:Fic family protein n=1 Tax=Methyloversatilis sp. TaxID=2569862 RepID=UPI002734EE7F|nr:Fic family protein [Methyloversatilis sp.]MDP2870119.1 Fic family protein [Methyloversatilis sp.]MDP3454551.1 Fic family protein [Methyloversatilis sp.]MDP3576830.1 Fic family protein [Methyloversatilis sp.]